MHTGVLHLVPSQVDVALANEQASLHRLQLVDVPSCVSQPGWALQSPKPLLQAPITHLPPTHEAAALGKLHAIPHMPQLLTSVLVSTQVLPHFVGMDAEQSEAQVGLPLALEQSGVGLVQAVVHDPQRAGVFTSVSQSGLAPSQLP